MTHKINHANIKEWARDYDGEPFDAILCDPPYELGFMGKSWDSSGIAFDTEMWSDLFRHIKPGGHLLAFSGSRTYHRMACAIEDAGFEIRDMIEWVYGSGFPKSLNIGKAVDKLKGNKRETVGEYKTLSPGDVWRINGDFGGESVDQSTRGITKGNSEWEGWGTALKPAHEPCVLARKPLEGTVAQNALKHGTGGLNIDGTRVGTETITQTRTQMKTWRASEGRTDIPDSADNSQTQTLGRFPANLIHDGSDEVVGLFPNTKSTPRTATKGGTGGVGVNTTFQRGSETSNFTDSGSAARFFYTAKLTQEELCEYPNYSKKLTHLMQSGTSASAENQATKNSSLSEKSYTKQDSVKNAMTTTEEKNAIYYCAKASKSERNAGLEGFKEVIRNDGRDVTLASGHMPQNRSNTPKANHHPTVKPLSLTKYLATLIKPPTGGRLLVPFSGSGSEMIGALQAGWEYVEGVELTEEYIPIAEARIKYWLEKKEPEQSKLL